MNIAKHLNTKYIKEQFLNVAEREKTLNQI